jgi:hypothetical protein
MRPMRTVDDGYPRSENESEAVLLERRWFAAHKAVQAMKIECKILSEVLNTAHANWRDANAKLADLDALCKVLERQYANYVEYGRMTPLPARVEERGAA